MSVRQSLLAILGMGPCYGSQLRAEFARRTGGARMLNVGQIYNTLERLERDALVRRGEVDAQGHVFWHVTDAGAQEADAWLRSPVPAGAAAEELAMKVALAATLPGVDVDPLLAAQRSQTQARLDDLRACGASRAASEDPARDAAAALVAHAEELALDARLRWLDDIVRMLDAAPEARQGLSEQRPRRGRPTRAEASH